MIPPSPFLTYCNFNVVKNSKFVILMITGKDFCKGCTNCCGYSHIVSKKCDSSDTWKSMWGFLKTVDDSKYISAWNLEFNNTKNKFAIVALTLSEGESLGLKATESLYVLKNEKYILYDASVPQICYYVTEETK
jgi:hypothetical protein